MIAIAKTDSLYFSSKILNAMQLMGSCDFEKIVSAIAATLYLSRRGDHDSGEI